MWGPNAISAPSFLSTSGTRLWRRFFLSVAIVFVSAAVGILLLVAYFDFLARSYDLTKLGEMPQRSIVFDRTGREIGRLHGENRIVITSEQIPEFFIKALVAREDSRFFRHEGIDILGIIRAAIVNVASGELRQGASTITQQLARNSYPLGGQTLHRKLIEAFLARRIENQFSKEQILEMYVNRIYFGSGLFGLEAAAQAYFGRPARDLHPGQSALLAGIIRSPSRFSPFRNLKAAQAERDAVLKRMVDEKMLSRAEVDAIRDTPLQLAPKPPITRQDNYMMDCVRRELDVILGDEYNGEGGLKIFTTLDADLQQAAETAVDAQLTTRESAPEWFHPRRIARVAAAEQGELPTEYVQGAAVVIHNETGGILAAVGGRDYLESKLNRALSTTRQAGSAIKPFVYSAAFERGLLPGTLISDDAIKPGEILAGGRSWMPANADNRYNGMLPASVGLVRSRNTMSVRVGEIAGLDEVRRVATLSGIAPWVPPNPAIYLGALEVSVKDTAAAYSVFPNMGKRRQAHLIRRVEELDGRAVFLCANIELQAIEPGAAWLTHECLVDVIERGTAARAKSLELKVRAAGKTGTTNDFHDAWFAGYTTGVTCAVWVGMDYPKPIMSRGYGSALALPIWVDIMNAAANLRYPAEDFRPPLPIEEVHVCKVTGLLATEGCANSGSSYLAKLPASRLPISFCQVHTGFGIPSQMDTLEEDRPNFFERIFGRRPRQPSRAEPGWRRN